MLTAYFKSAPTIARYRAGSAGPHLDRFVAWLADQGYRRVSIRRHVREVANFAAWAESVGLGTSPLVEESNCVTGFNACFPLDRSRKVTHLPARPRKQLCQLIASERKSVNSQL